jgi:hypothetical protein
MYHLCRYYVAPRLATAAIYACMLTEIMPEQEVIKAFLDKLKGEPII